MSFSTINFVIRLGMLTQCFLFVTAGDAVADGGTSETQPKTPSQASENYYKTDKFLPGEEVVSTTGKKMKVWSTTGPVAVSSPLKPFDDPNQQINGSNIIIDGTSGYRHRRCSHRRP